MKYKSGNHVKFSILLIIFCLVFLITSGCNRDEVDNKRKDFGPVNTEVVDANTQFGFNLFSEIRETNQDKNIFISPFSVSVALAMTLNGAAGETEQAIADVLQLNTLDAEAINPGYVRLHQGLQASDPKVTLTIANSLWARQDVPFKADFLARNTEFFDAEISTLNFSDPKALTTINQWVDTNTNGKIPKILDKIDPNEVLFLINTIYFKGEWKEQFDPSDTRNGTFYLLNGGEKSVPMMGREGGYPYYQGEGFRAISLPYGDGQVGMYIFLPNRESDLNTFLENLNVENWESWVSQLYTQEVYVQIPKFKLEFGTNLVDVLKVLGMEIAFDENQADFSRMASYGPNLYITKVDHKAIVEVNEEGTVAAAVTSVGVGEESAPPEFIADRPFFFAIRDNETGTVLFMGTVVDPQP